MKIRVYYFLDAVPVRGKASAKKLRRSGVRLRKLKL